MDESQPNPNSATTPNIDNTKNNESNQHSKDTKSKQFKEWQTIANADMKNDAYNPEEEYVRSRLIYQFKENAKKEELVHEKELRYPRKKYEILLYGNSIHEFSADLQERISEIDRCKKINDPGSAQIVTIDNNAALRIMVDNYEDFIELKNHGRWMLLKPVSKSKKYHLIFT